MVIFDTAARRREFSRNNCFWNKHSRKFYFAGIESARMFARQYLFTV